MTVRPVCVLGVAILLSCLVWTCSDSESGPSIDRPTMVAGAEAFCDDVDQLLCDYWTACLPDDAEQLCADFANGEFLGDGCAAAVAGVESGQLDFHPAAADACRAAHSDGVCEGLPIYSDGCEPVFTSNGRAGDPCGISIGTWNGCAEAFYCDLGVEADMCPGTCRPRAAIGEPCDIFGACLDGYCNLDTSVCTPNPGAGESCNFARCPDDLDCAYNEATDLAICMVLGAEGDDCNESWECEGFAVCLDGTCRTSVGAADPCRSSEQCPTDHACAPNEDGDSVCRPLGDVGDECSFEVGSGCRDNLQCLSIDRDGETAQECFATPEVGEPCAADYFCPEGAFCYIESEQGPPICREHFEAGQACTNVFGGFAECVADFYCLSPDGEAPAVCRGPNAEGAPCFFYQSDQTCEPGLQCMIREFMNVCEGRAAAGESCNPFRSNPRDSCEAGLFCFCPNCFDAELEDWQNTCVPLRQQGEPCDDQAWCEDDLVCDYSTDEGLCQPAPDPDDPDNESGVCFL